MSEPSAQALIVAGEASSALYALRILEKFKDSEMPLHFFGVGNADMVNLGFEAVGRSEEMAVVGIQEVLAHYSDIKRVFDNLITLATERKPKFILLLDYPDFNLRLAKKLKPLGIPIIYYISPQVWAWRKGRVKIIRKLIDKMLVLFPFEEVFYKDKDVPTVFVGHPLLDELGDQLFDPKERQFALGKFGVKPSEKVLGLMPGSRRSEIKFNLNVQIDTARKLVKANPNLMTLLFVAPSFSVEEFQSFLPENLDFPLILVKDEPFTMIRLADVVLTASGTATLMVGLMEKPMVIMYKMKPTTALLARYLVGDKKPFGMINLVLEERVCPEFFQEKANPVNMGEALHKLLNETDHYEAVVKKLKQAKEKLGQRGATERVIEVLKGYL